MNAETYGFKSVFNRVYPWFSSPLLREWKFAPSTEWFVDTPVSG